MDKKKWFENGNKYQRNIARLQSKKIYLFAFMARCCQVYFLLIIYHMNFNAFAVIIVMSCLMT